MSRTLLVAGTASHVGKSTVVAGLCRRLADDGVSVAPFKAQNMSNNARAVPTASGEGFGEIGVSQYVQARAARIRPTTDLNPVLLKPRGDGESQVVVDGEARGHVRAGRYYDDHWMAAREAAVTAHGRLAAEFDVVVAEGAGSIAEINLHHRDLANVETARFADAEILLVGDIERGGVFASLVGTLELVPEDLRERVVGVVITKFRGDRSLLDPGLSAFESRTGVPVRAVLPYDDPGLPEEDSVSLPPPDRRAVFGDDDGLPSAEGVTVAVPRLPHISNFTDLDPLADEPGVRVAYVPLDDDLTTADAVVLPGTKNSVDDLLALHESGMVERLGRFEGPMVGLCGGYQLLGERLTNAAVEGTTVGEAVDGEAVDGEAVDGVGRLPVETRFSTEKRVESVTVHCEGIGPLTGASGALEGYEIHSGETTATAPVARPFTGADGRNDASLGVASGAVLGTYLHGLFENDVARAAFVDTVFDSTGRERPEPSASGRSPYERVATLLAPLDLGALDLTGG